MTKFLLAACSLLLLTGCTGEPTPDPNAANILPTTAPTAVAEAVDMTDSASDDPTSSGTAPEGGADNDGPAEPVDEADTSGDSSDAASGTSPDDDEAPDATAASGSPSEGTEEFTTPEQPSTDMTLAPATATVVDATAAESDEGPADASMEEPTVEPPPGYVPGNPATHPLAIERMRGVSYPGSDLVVVQELPPGSNYSRSVATYESEGLTIRGLLTIPNGERPGSGWPVVIFNHGYIPPAQYRTTERYVAYQDAFARAGYITYKSDYRGHGSSEGESGSSRGSPAYTVDVLNAMASVARHPDADPNRIGMWGHSMGGLITLRSMVISDQIKAGVIWAGVVASYPDLYNRLGRDDRSPRWSDERIRRRGWRNWRRELEQLFGTPEENPSAWDAVSPNAWLSEISGPLQLHHGTADSSVPVIYSTRLQEQMEAAGQPSETFVYEGDDHNLSGSLTTALARSVEFFDQHVKGGG